MSSLSIACICVSIFYVGISSNTLLDTSHFSSLSSSIEKAHKWRFLFTNSTFENLSLALVTENEKAKKR